MTELLIRRSARKHKTPVAITAIDSAGFINLEIDFWMAQRGRLEPVATTDGSRAVTADAACIDFDGFWKQGEEPNIKNLSHSFRSKGFYGIIGKVGSGKSSLLAAILEEVPFCKGSMLKKGSVVHVEQEAVIFSASGQCEGECGFRKIVLEGQVQSDHGRVLLELGLDGVGAEG